jgi:hypothetical protein
MRFKTVILSLIYIVTALISTGKTAEALSSREELLQAELELAQKPQIYFMLNLEGKKVYFKARGIVLKEMPVDDIRFWGNMSDVQSYTLTKKSSFATPVRDKINPEKEEAEKDEKKDEKEKFQLKALELSDMPASYTLWLNGNVFITVGPIGEGAASKLYSAARSFSWYLSRPFYSVWNAVNKRPYTALHLRLKKEDAQALYWSFVEGGMIIIY